MQNNLYLCRKCGITVIGKDYHMNMRRCKTCKKIWERKNAEDRDKRTTLRAEMNIPDCAQLCPKCNLVKDVTLFRSRRVDATCIECQIHAATKSKRESAQRKAAEKKSGDPTVASRESDLKIPVLSIMQSRSLSARDGFQPESVADQPVTQQHFACKDCGRHGPKNEFYSNEKCLECHKEYMKSYKRKPQPSRSKSLGATVWDCARCKNVLPIDHFKAKKLGNNSVCRNCTRERGNANARSSRANNPKAHQPEKVPPTEWTCCVCHQLLPIANFSAEWPSKKSKCTPCQTDWNKQRCKKRRQEKKESTDQQ